VSPSFLSHAERWLRILRRIALSVLGFQVALAVGLSLVDSYRRRGKKPQPFPVTPPRTVSVGNGELTTYTFGRDLYDDMIEAIEGARRQVLFETYIWKGDAVGQRFKDALAAAAARGVEVYCIYDGFANLVVNPVFKRFPHTMKVLRYPVYTAVWKLWDLRRNRRNRLLLAPYWEYDISQRHWCEVREAFELAEEICRRLPSVERIRFTNSARGEHGAQLRHVAALE
jgi:cardiolipin synthase A/B